MKLDIYSPKAFNNAALLVVVTIISVVGLSPFLPLFDLDEGAFSEATREMLESGNWVSTFLNGEPRHDKPILIYWLQAISVKAFGVHPFSFRLPSIICAFAWIWLIYRFTCEYVSTQAGALSVWLISCCWLSTIIFKAAIADALLNLILCATFFEIYRYSVSPSSKKLWLIGALLGLGFLTKGPIALVLPAVSSLIAYVLCGRTRDWLLVVFHPFIWLMFIVIILPWHVAVYLDQGLEFFKGFYLGHNLGRFSDTMESHGGSVFYYVLMLPLILLPFSRLFFVDLKELVSSLRGGENNLFDALMWSWFFITFVIFSLSQTQLPHYLLYGLTPIFILLSRRIARDGVQVFDLLLGVFFIILFALVPLLANFAISSIPKAFDRAVVELLVNNYFSGFYIVSIALIVFAGILVFLQKIPLLNRTLTASFLIVFSFNFLLAPLIAGAQQEPVRRAAKSIYGTDRDVIAYRIDMPSFSVYMNRIIPKSEPEPGQIVYTRVDKVDKLLGLDKQIVPELLYQQGGIALYQYGLPGSEKEQGVENVK